MQLLLQRGFEFGCDRYERMIAFAPVGCACASEREFPATYRQLQEFPPASQQLAKRIDTSEASHGSFTFGKSSNVNEPEFGPAVVPASRGD